MTDMWADTTHCLISVNEAGEGPVPPSEADREECWCLDPNCRGGVAEQADAPDSSPGARKGVGVRLPSPPPSEGTP